MSVNDDTKWKNGHNSKLHNLKDALELRAQSMQPMNGFKLPFSNLENINLYDSKTKSGYTLTNSDLYKANFKNAHCFKINLSGSNLMKSSFENANLHYANLKRCNLLGVNFKNAKLENVQWDDEVIQEKEANKTEDKEKQIELYQEAEEIYRNLRKVTEEDGLFEHAGYFFQKEMQMRRKKLPLFSIHRFVSKIVDFSCGYGERPLRIILLTSIVILIYSVIFFFMGLSYNDGLQQFRLEQSFNQNLYVLFNALYFSVVTFTTTGYGDILPIGVTKLFAASEALLGGFILAIFVIVFVKKMTR